MCGITYFHQKDIQSAAKATLKRFHAQKERGTQGFGFVAFSLDTKEISHYIRQEDEAQITQVLNGLKALGEKTNAILFHHRNPTSTINIAECAHPIFVDHPELEYVYFVIHNGVISNDSTLKKEHENLGYKYTTEITKEESWTTSGSNPIRYSFPKEARFNDSEAAAIELARFIEGKSKKFAATGSMALVTLQVSRENKAVALYFGRNHQNPLYLEESDQSFCLKSVGSWADIVSTNKLYRYDYQSCLTTEKECSFGDSYTPYYGKDWGKEIAAPKERSLYDDEEPVIHTAPAMSTGAYLAMPSQMDQSIETWLSAGNSLEIQQEECIQEWYLVNDILEWESIGVKDKTRIEKLEKRMKELDTRLDILDDRIIKTETDSYGLEPEDGRKFGFRTANSTDPYVT